jgi:hypothetical protein
MMPDDNIGYPKLFVSCKRAFKKPAQRAVNNFAANRTATASDWPLDFIFGVSVGGAGGVTGRAQTGLGHFPPN